MIEGWSWRWLAKGCVVVAGLLCGLLAAGCGSSDGGGLPAGIVVRVGRYTVTKAELAHWIPIEAIVSQEVIPKGAIPQGMVPDPPSYSRCIPYQRAFLRAKPGGFEEHPTTAQLKRECRERLERAREHILNILVVYGWLREEAAAHNLKASDAEAQQRFRKNTLREFKTYAAYQQFLARTGLTQKDELLRIKNNMLSELALEKIFPHQPNPKQAYPEFLLRWAHKTHCAPEYIIPDCSEYKGTQTPNT